MSERLGGSIKLIQVAAAHVLTLRVEEEVEG